MRQRTHPITVLCITAALLWLVQAPAAAQVAADDPDAGPEAIRRVVESIATANPRAGAYLAPAHRARTRSLPDAMLHAFGQWWLPVLVGTRDRTVLSLWQQDRAVAAVTIPGQLASVTLQIRDVTGDRRAEIEIANRFRVAPGHMLRRLTVFGLELEGDDAEGRPMVGLRELLAVTVEETVHADPGRHYEESTQLSWVDVDHDGALELRVRRERVTTTPAPHYRPLPASLHRSEDLYSLRDGGYWRSFHRVLREPSAPDLIEMARHFEQQGAFQRAAELARQCVDRYADARERDALLAVSDARMIAARYAQIADPALDGGRSDNRVTGESSDAGQDTA